MNDKLVNAVAEAAECSVIACDNAGVVRIAVSSLEDDICKTEDKPQESPNQSITRCVISKVRYIKVSCLFFFFFFFFLSSRKKNTYNVST